MSEAQKQVLGVLASGRGTDLQSIIDAVERGEIHAMIGVVISDNPDAFALMRAKKAGIPAICVNRKQYEGREPFEEALIKELEAKGVTLVVLAGFMRILTPLFVRHYKGRILNIHPALLPSFPGAHAHRDVLAYDTESTLGARVLEQEHKLYPQVIEWYCEGRLHVDGRHVRIDK